MKVKGLIVVIVMILAFGLCEPTILALDTTDWTGGDGAWETSTNWDNGVPDTTKSANISNSGTARITNNGMSCAYLTVGKMNGETGNVVMTSPGSLVVQNLEGAENADIGLYGTGVFTQESGSVDIGDVLNLGRYSSGDGTYKLQGGSLLADILDIGCIGKGLFEMDSTATLTVGWIRLGGYPDGDGTIHAKDLSAACQIVTQNFELRQTGKLIVETGGLILEFEGSAFDNLSQDESNAEGLRRTEMIFKNSGGSGTFEVAGLVDGGFTNNFALGALTVSDSFALQFVNAHDNGNGDAECLFAEALGIELGSTLDIANLWLYADGNVESTLDGWITDGRLFNSLGPIDAIYVPEDDWTVVTPEPTTIILLGLGGLVLRRKRRI